MKRLVIVPARGGSKRFPGKNKALLGGKPLILHAIDAVKNCFDMVIFSSDSDELIDIAKKERVVVDKRPAKLATDKSKVLDTVNYYYDMYENDFEQIWLTLPTCPLKTESHMIMAQKLLTDDIDGIVSVTDFEFPPSLGLNLSKNNIISESNPNKPFATSNTRSQDHPQIYRPNGAFYGAHTSSFGRHRNFFKGKVRGVFMSRIQSVDIDNELDLKWAQFVADNIIKGEE